MAAWRGYTDHRDYGDEWQPRASEDAHEPSAPPPPATIPDRSRRDADVRAKIVAFQARDRDAALLRQHCERVETANATLRDEALALRRDLRKVTDALALARRGPSGREVLAACAVALLERANATMQRWGV
jgi:hypothetical protein